MTKKRFRMSMAALGLLAAFFMVLIAVLLAPTLASAGKDTGASHHHGGMPDTGSAEGGSGGSGGNASVFADNWNVTDHDHGNAYDAPFCVEDGVTPCADPDAGRAFGGADGNPDDFVGDFAAGGSANGADGASHDDGRYTPNFWGGGPGIGGGQGGGKPGANESGNPNEEEGEQTKPEGRELPPANFAPPGEEQPFVDPNNGGDPDTNGPKSDGPKDGPKDGNPPNQLTPDTDVTKIPEPLTLSLFAAGLAGAAGLRRRARRRS